MATGIEILIDKSCMRKATYLREAASLYREIYAHKGVEVLIVKPCVREAIHIYEKIYIYENLREICIRAVDRNFKSPQSSGL